MKSHNLNTILVYYEKVQENLTRYDTTTFVNITSSKIFNYVMIQIQLIMSFIFTLRYDSIQHSKKTLRLPLLMIRGAQSGQLWHFVLCQEQSFCQFGRGWSLWHPLMIYVYIFKPSFNLPLSIVCVIYFEKSRPFLVIRNITDKILSSVWGIMADWYPCIHSGIVSAEYVMSREIESRRGICKYVEWKR
jgi:hypothetical protein